MASLSKDRGQPDKAGKLLTVRISKPKGRPIQLRYTCPDEARELRISTGTTDGAGAIVQKKQLEAK